MKNELLLFINLKNQLLLVININLFIIANICRYHTIWQSEFFIYTEWDEETATSYLFKFFLNFIEWKQKMSEIKSNFRTSLDFFELATFGVNYGLQTLNGTVTRYPKVALRYFIPMEAKRFLEVNDTVVFFSANLAFQNTSGTIVQSIGIRRFWWPLCGGNEATNLIF